MPKAAESAQFAYSIRINHKIMWRLSSLCSAKGAGATAAGIIFAVSSWRSFDGSASTADRGQKNDESGGPVLTGGGFTSESGLRKSHYVANCTTEQSLGGRHGIHPSISKIPPPLNDSEDADHTVGQQKETEVSSNESALSPPNYEELDVSTTAISRCRKLIRRTMLERGIPGAVVAVMKDGQMVWSEGIGYADVENDVPCSSDTSMRIASISKPLTTVALMQLWQKGEIDLDAPIQKYVPEFPEKEYEGEKVVITTRQLLSHLSGIRHYSKLNKNESETKDVKEFDKKEYYISSHCDTVRDALKLFDNDELLSKPGTEYLYTTHGWTLISAVIEKVSNKEFLQYMTDHVFKPLGMSSTGGEFHKPLVYGRARHYVRCEGGLLQNTPYVDISYKWAGGGFISTAKDLTKFGNALLICYQLNSLKPVTSNTTSCQSVASGARGNGDKTLQKNQMECTHHSTPRCILKSDTIAMMWSPAVCPYKSQPEVGYGMGWMVREGDSGTIGGKDLPFYAAHSGGSVGASSILVIMPSKSTTEAAVKSRQTKPSKPAKKQHPDIHLQDRNISLASLEVCRPRGVVVAVLFNLQEVKNVTALGVQIAEEFL